MRLVFVCCLFFVFDGISQTVNYNDVAVITNLNSELSQTIGNHFKTVRNIPAQNMIYVDAPTTEIIDSAQFVQIKNQIENYLTNTNLKDSINYLVTTKGIPLKVGNNCIFDSLPQMSCASFDSEIGLILGDYSSFIGKSGPLQNPYYGNTTHFSRTNFGFYLVTRLDGYTLSDVINLIDRSGSLIGINKNSAKTIVDVSNGFDGDSIYFSDVFTPAFDFLAANSWNSILDLNFEALKEQSNVFLYLGVGHGPLPFQQLDYEFVNGSASIMEMCSSSFTFDFELKGENDLLLGDLIADGCTAGYGNVDYIFFGNIMNPALFVDRYLNPTENYNLAEAFYMAGRTLSWQTVIIGDPKSRISIDNTASLITQSLIEPSIYPNPSTGKITINSTEKIISVCVLDLKGALLNDLSNLDNTDVTFNLSDLKAGSYFIQIVTEKGVYQKRIQKMNH
jgi:uncharacterized protein (TIGR03790 family)